MSGTRVSGTGAALAKCGSGAAQHWAYAPDWNPGGTGLLTTHGECLEVASSVGDPRVTLAPCTHGASQQWQALTLGELYNPASGECLTDPLAGDTPVQAAPCDSTPGQSWQLPASEVASGAAGQCLTDPGDSTSNGTQLVLGRCAGAAAAQAWSLQADGTLQLHGRCLDVRGGSVRIGAAVQLYSCFGGINEIWITGPDGELINANSGLCLAAASSAPDSGDALVQQDCTGSIEEIWTIS